MTDDRIREAGRRLGEAWLAARPVDAYPEDLRAGSRNEAYAIQDAMAAVIGESITGWKLGAATDPQPVQSGSVVRAHFATLGAIDITVVD